MALREIVKLGENILRERAKEVTDYDDRLSTLIDDMIETMFFAKGVGLAAPQVGILKRVCVVSVDEGENIYELINPVIIKESGVQCGIEGCLSIPGNHGYVNRPKKMIVNAFNRCGEQVKYKVEGYLAIAFSHEIDHLNGVLFTDKIVREADNL